MKRLLFIASVFLCAVYPAQDFQAVNKAFKAADITLISPFLAETMDMEICDKGGIMSNKQAHMLLDHFFKVNRVFSFELLHVSALDLKKQHVIGEYRTAKGSFTLIFLIEDRDGRPCVRQVHIDRAS